MNKAHQYRQNAPRNNDSRQPFSRTPRFDQKRSGNLEKKIAEEENARAETENFRIETQILRHFKRGVTEVHAVNKGDDKQTNQKRQQAARNAFFSCGFQFRSGCCR